MNTANDRLEKFPGERLGRHLLLQDLTELSNRLEQNLTEDDDSKKKFDQQRLYTHGKTTASLIRFDKGGYITDQVVENGTVIIQVLEGKICFQADGEHRHPKSGQNIVVKLGISHSVQGEKPSTILLTIIRE